MIFLKKVETTNPDCITAHRAQITVAYHGLLTTGKFFADGRKVFEFVWYGKSFRHAVSVILKSLNLPEFKDQSVLDLEKIKDKKIEIVFIIIKNSLMSPLTGLKWYWTVQIILVEY